MSAPKKVKSGRTGLLFVITGIVLAVVCAAVFWIVFRPAIKAREYIQTAEKYLEGDTLYRRLLFSEILDERLVDPDAAGRNYERAVEAYEMALEYDPENVDAYCGMAYAFLAMGNHEDAIDAYEEALEYDADNCDAYLGLVFAYYDYYYYGYFGYDGYDERYEVRDRLMETADDAIDAYEDALENGEQKNGDNYLGLALVYRCMHDGYSGKTEGEIEDALKKAVALYEEAIEKEPEYENNYPPLIVSYLLLADCEGMDEKTIHRLEELAADYGEVTESRDTKEWLEEHMGNDSLSAEKRNVINDTQMCYTIQTAVVTVFMDPEIVVDSESVEFINSLRDTECSFRALLSNSNLYTDGVKAVLGISSADDIVLHSHRSYGTVLTVDDIYVTLHINGAEVRIAGSDATGNMGSDPKNAYEIHLY